MYAFFFSFCHCFHIVTREQISLDRDCIDHKAYVIYHLTLYEKIFPTPTTGKDFVDDS